MGIRKRKAAATRAARQRNPVAAALRAGPGAKGAGPHGKSRRAQRRAAKVALAKEVAGG